jgi:predicted nucleic acid-binding protein
MVLDTNIVLYLLGGDKTIASFLDGKQVYLSVISELELLGYPDLKAKDQQQIKRFLEDCTIIDLNDNIKNTYAVLRKKYRLKMGDAIVAATAIALDMPFVTADKGFQRIKELQLTLYNPLA